MKILVAGPKEYWLYFCEQYFVGHITEHFFKEISLPDLPSFVRRNKDLFDLAIICTDRWSSSLFFRHFLCTPTLISLYHNTSKGFPKSKNLKNYLYKIKNKNWEYRITKSEKDLSRFYEQYYLPFVLKRHKEQAVIVPYKTFQRALLNGYLLQVVKNECVIAGVLCTEKNNVLHLSYLGVSNQVSLKDKILYALYFFNIQYAKSIGYDKVSLGGCRPNLLDGVVQHKRKWGVEIMPYDSCYYNYVFYWSKKTNALKEFISRTMIIIQNKSGKYSVLTTRNNSAEKIRKNIWIKGLDNLCFID